MRCRCNFLKADDALKPARISPGQGNDLIYAKKRAVPATAFLWDWQSFVADDLHAHIAINPSSD